MQKSLAKIREGFFSAYVRIPWVRGVFSWMGRHREYNLQKQIVCYREPRN